MKMTKNIIIILFLFINLNVFASENIRTVKLKSKALNETRDLMIRLPENYYEDNSKNYPVLVTLNGTDNFHWASDIVDIQSSRFGIEDMIVVGLPHSGNYNNDNFPYKDGESTELNPQAQKYSSFIREEALAYIEENYRTNGGRFIIGHSLSGLFVLKLFMQFPKSFSSYIVISPSAQYTPQMSKELTDFLSTQDELNCQLFLSIGEIEHSLIQKGFNSISKAFEENAPSDFTWKLSYLDHTDHLLSAYKGTYDGLAWLYRDWHISESNMRTYSLDDYVAHYELLSQKLMYTLKPREKHLIGFSWFAANRLDDLNAAITAVRAGLYFYPESLELKERLEELNKSKG
jgi:predicted alpha/beta superfamily hydrolase